MNEPRFVNVQVMVDWQRGDGKPLIDEASAVSSDEPLFSAAVMLRKYADQLDEMSQRERFAS